MKYPCIMCGLCCSFLSGISELEHLDSGNGVCVHLKNNRCEIYSSRPMLCNTEQMWKAILSEDMSEGEFIFANLCGCLSLNKQFGYMENVEKLKEILETLRQHESLS